jgi:formyl-CoA transferase
MSTPLEGIRILDWTVWQQGPVATALLGDLGAEVIKIEDKAGGDPGRGLQRARGISTLLPGGRNFYFEYNNHNKKSIALDLKKEKGREVIYRLVKKADVFVQNFRKGVATRLGVDYATLSQYNTQIIYATASGYGPKGPDSEKPAMDYQGLARSGIMTAIGEPEMPPLGMAGGIADQMGAIMLAYGVLAALLARERLGIGQEVDVSHLGSMVTLQGLNVAASLLVGKVLPRLPRAKADNPLWNHYRCKDGKWIALAHLQADKYWGDFCRALGIEELERDPRFENMTQREENSQELISILDKKFATKTYAEWEKILREQGDFIFTKIQEVSDLASDPQVIENEYVVDYDHPALGKIKMVGSAVRYSKTPTTIRLPAPELGEHTREILSQLGEYSDTEIAQLEKEGVI